MADLLADPPIRVRKARELEPLAIGLKDAARMLNVSERHLQVLALAGKIPSAMVGCRRVFRVATIDAWLIEQESKYKAQKQQERP